MPAGRHYAANSVDLVLEQGIVPALCSEMLMHRGTCDVGAVFAAPAFATTAAGTTERAALAACDFIDANVREWRTTLRWVLSVEGAVSAATATHVLCMWNGWLHTIHALAAWLMAGAEGDVPTTEMEAYRHENVRMAALASTGSIVSDIPTWVVQACAASALELLTQSDILFTARCVLGLRASLTTLRPPLARSADELCCLQRRNTPSYFARDAFAQQRSATSFVQTAWDAHYMPPPPPPMMAAQQQQVVAAAFSEFATREVAVLSNDRELEAKAGGAEVLPVVCTLCVWMHEPLKAFLAARMQQQG